MARVLVCTAAFLMSAGCLSAPGPMSLPPPDSPAGVGTLELLPSGEQARQLLWDFAMGHPNRRADSPATWYLARGYLRGELDARGLDVVEQQYRDTGVNVLGFHWGTTKPDEWVVLSCHYDTIETTVFGARDDGLGCAALIEMAGSFSSGAWNRTLVFAFFDEEEQGLIGARAFLAEYLEAQNVTLAANLNFDPAGLHWPCGDALGQYKVHLMITLDKVEGPEAVPGYAELLAASIAGFRNAGVPEEYIEVATNHAYLVVAGQEFLRPGSDDDAFDQYDIPAIWFGAPPTDETGPLRVWGYPNHTPPDTAQAVEARCGSADLMAQGLQVSMTAAMDALTILDAQTWSA